jgi:hypothetical protein
MRRAGCAYPDDKNFAADRWAVTFGRGEKYFAYPLPG